MIRSLLFIIGLILTVGGMGAKGAIVSVENGDFGKVSDGNPAGWHGSGQYRVIDKGGVDGKPAVELTCDSAGKTSSLTQIVRPTSELVGSVRISAWMKCIQVEDGGDCSIWLDTLLEDGGAIWGKQGNPERDHSGWQKVSAIVTYWYGPLTSMYDPKTASDVRKRGGEIWWYMTRYSKDAKTMGAARQKMLKALQ
jgi:hypothetical protein